MKRRRTDDATVRKNERVDFASTKRITTTSGAIDEKSFRRNSDTHQTPNIQVRVEKKVSRREMRSS